MEGIEPASERDRSSECSTSGRKNLEQQIQDCRYYGSKIDSSAQRWLFSRLVGLLQEREFPCDSWKSYDKAFACAWLSEHQVVVGTKCNRLLLLNSNLHRRPDIPLLQEVPLPQPPPREAPTEDVPALLSPIRNALWTIRAQINNPGSESSQASVAEEFDTVRGMIARAVAALDQPHPLLPGHFPAGVGGVQAANCGIHSISLSPGGTMLASGGAEPSDCQIFRVAEQGSGAIDLQPMQTLVGHKDWIFGSAWVTDRHIVTGSRDRCLKLWCLNPWSSEANEAPLQTRPAKSGKVRDVKYLEDRQRIASLVVDGSVHFWDCHLEAAGMVRTKHEREVVCMASSESLLAVGSQNHVSLVDARLQDVAGCLLNPDHNHGVRSLAFCHNLLSVGGGQGRIHFCDLRMQKFLEEAVGSPVCLQTGGGYLARNQVYLDHFEGAEVKNACYAHAWDTSRSRLLSVGGPLAFGLTGCYMGIWE